jgi:glycosyltransferase involved in cell wall biosynthesis
MPIFNGARFLKIALDSLLSQKFKDFELIISDNASTDRTSEILGEYAEYDPRIRIIRHESNIGPRANFQSVLEKSIGVFFMWAAHDDIWHPEYIMSCVSLLEANPHALIAFSGFREGKLVVNSTTSHPSVFDLDGRNGNDKHYSMYKFLQAGPPPGSLNIIYGLMRRETLIKADILQKWEYAWYGDEIFGIINLLRYGCIVFDKRQLWTKRSPEESRGTAKAGPCAFSRSSALLFNPSGVFETASNSLNIVRGVYKALGPIPNEVSVPRHLRVYWSMRYLLRTLRSLSLKYFESMRRRAKAFLPAS